MSLWYICHRTEVFFGHDSCNLKKNMSQSLHLQWIHKNNWINNVKGETICSIVAKNEILCCESEDHSSIILIAVIHWIVIKQVHIQTYAAIFLISSDWIEFFIESRLPPPTHSITPPTTTAASATLSPSPPHLLASTCERSRFTFGEKIIKISDFNNLPFCILVTFSSSGIISPKFISKDAIYDIGTKILSLQ